MKRIYFWAYYLNGKLSKSTIVAGLTALLLLIAVMISGEDIYDDQWFIVGTFAILALAWRMRRFFRWPIVLMGVYLAEMVLYFNWRGEDLIQISIRPTVLYLQSKQTLFLFALFLAANVTRKYVFKVIQWATPLFAIVTLCGKPLLFNESMNAALLVACLPLCVWQWPITLALVTACVYFTQYGSTAYAMIVLFFVSRAVRVGKLFSALLLWNGAVFLFYRVASEPSMRTDSARFEFYKHAWDFFWKYGNPYHGSGVGTGMLFGPVIQKLNNFNTHQMWLSFHSDLLQWFFEGGIIGFALGVWLFLDSLRHSDLDSRLSLLMLMVCAIFYFPMQIPIIAFLAMWLVAISQRRTI